MAVFDACSGTKESSSAASTELNVGLGLDISDLNGFDLTISSYPVMPSIYDTMVEYDAEGKAQPRLAKSWTIAPDNSSVTVKLRSGLQFHNGEPIDAKAIAANFEKANDPDFSFQVYSIVSPIKKVAADSSDTLRITLQHPAPDQVITDILASVNLMAPKALDFEALKSHGVGAGPFMQESYVPHSQLTLKRFGKWWKKPGPTVDRINFHISSDYDSAVASLQAGSLDLIPFLPPNQAKKIADNMQIYVGPTGLEVYPLRINPSAPPFDKKQVRQGLHYAINRDAIVKNVFYGYGEPTVLLFGKSSPAFDPRALSQYPFDLRKARQMFESAGEPNWTATANLLGSDTVGQAIIQIIQADLAKIGVHLKVNLTGPTENASMAFSGNYQMMYGIFGNCGKYPSWVTLNSLCRVQNNPVLKGKSEPILHRWKAAVEAANRAVTKPAQEKSFAELRNVLLDESWVIPISMDKTLIGLRKGVTGVRINREDFVVLEDAKVSK